jgi:His/Glu/Gln/Arg/opine family amino acid ABC transporter permease subunit
MNLAYDFRWSFIWDNHRLLLDALVRTLEISLIAIAGSAAIGIVLGAARAARIPVLSQLTAVYVEVIRNTPILVQIFFIFFALPEIGITLPQFTAAWLCLMLWGGAFNVENFRAGFEAVPHEYREAGLALGFSRLGTFFYVTLPIGGRIALPSSINTYSSVLKNSAIVGPAVAYAELTHTAFRILEATGRTFEIFLVLGVVYLVLVWSLSALIRLLEGRLALPEEAR